MLIFILFLSVFLLALLTTEGNKRKGVIGVFAALLYFPIGVILALTKKYK